MAMVAIARGELIALARRHFRADDDGLLADVEMAEAADDAHAVQLPGLLLEAADEQHLAKGAKLLLARESRNGLSGARAIACIRHRLFPASQAVIWRTSGTIPESLVQRRGTADAFGGQRGAQDALFGVELRLQFLGEGR